MPRLRFAPRTRLNAFEQLAQTLFLGSKAWRGSERGLQVGAELIDLFHQVVLDPHLLELVELCLKPVDVLLLVGED